MFCRQSRHRTEKQHQCQAPAESSQFFTSKILPILFRTIFIVQPIIITTLSTNYNRRFCNDSKELQNPDFRQIYFIIYERMGAFFCLRRVASATLFPAVAGIGSLSECNELSEQALFRVAILRGAVLFNRRTFLLNDSLHALRTDHRLQIKILSG